MFDPHLVIFDKDGTLIDFHAMWGGWAIALARDLEAAAGMPVAEPLFAALEFDPVASRVAPAGPLALWPMASLRELVVDVLRAAGCNEAAVQAAITAAWRPPDPAALAHPLADLPQLFGAIRAYGARIAIATTDDRAPTLATLAALGVAPLVDALACADDGLPDKPAPDMVLALCRSLGVPPAHTVVVGDNVVDLLMGRAAGVGLVIGVLSGLGAAADLAPHADRLLPSIAELPLVLWDSGHDANLRSHV